MLLSVFSGILASTEEEEEKQEYVSIIENNNTLLLQLISDILDLSKIEAGTLELNYSNIELNELMRELERGFLVESEDGCGETGVCGTCRAMYGLYGKEPFVPIDD